MLFKITACKKPIVEVITSAKSEDPDIYYRKYKNIFESWEPQKVNYIAYYRNSI